MSKANLPKYVKWRDGRPRWELGGEGGKKLRKAGWSSLDLKDARGDWLSFEGARIAGERLNLALTSWRRGDETPDKDSLMQLISDVPGAAALVSEDLKDWQPDQSRATGPQSWTFNQLFDRYEASDEFRALSKTSQATYSGRLRVLRYWLGPDKLSSMRPSLSLRLFNRLLDVGYLRHQWVGTENAMSLHKGYHDAVIRMSGADRDALRNDRLEFMEDDDDAALEPPGYNTSFGTMATARSCWNWATRHHDLTLVNPFARLNLATPSGRIRFVEEAEFRHIIATADAIGRPHVGDAAVLGRETVQRRGDLVRISWSIRQRGDWSLTQSKTRKPVAARCTRILTERLDLAWRRECGKTVTPDPNGPILNIPAKQLTHEWRLVVNEAAKTMPSLTGVMLHDMRDTGFTRLLLAGNDLVRACQVSGHSIKHASTIERHYLACRRQLADQAVDKLDAFSEQG